jgi:HPt (histidine-containing phosphotransfer) domain-containing protein
MDIQMPEMDGMEATRVIRQRQADQAHFPNYKSSIVIVAMTANAMVGDRERCIAGGMDDYVSKPIRPEDMRRIIERWAAAATIPETAKNSGPAKPSAPQSTGAARVEEISTNKNSEAQPPVDMSRLLDFTNGNPDDLRELIALYLKQTGEQVAQLSAAVAADSAIDVKRVAHSCAGASATCGMTRIVPLLRELERQGAEGKLSGAKELEAQVRDEFNQIKIYLENYLENQTALAAQT